MIWRGKIPNLSLNLSSRATEVLLLIFLIFSSSITPTVAFSIPEVSEGDVVTVDWTEEAMNIGRMRWNKFLEDCVREGTFMDTFSSFLDVTLHLEFDFDDLVISGYLSGMSDNSSSRLHSFQGEITGTIKKDFWRGWSWYWEWEGSANIALHFTHRQWCPEGEESHWNTRDETIQVTAILSGRGWPGNNSNSGVDLRWEDDGGLDGSARNFLLTFTEMRVQWPEPIDLKVEIDGPEEILVAADRAVFNVLASGIDSEKVEQIIWDFQYIDAGDAWYLDDFETNKLESLTIEKESLDKWVWNLNEYGELANGEKTLQMKIKVRVYADLEEEALLIEPFEIGLVLSSSDVASKEYRLTGYGAPLVGMEVVLRNENGAASTETDSYGYYVVPGSYIESEYYEMELRFAFLQNGLEYFRIIAGDDEPVKLKLKIEKEKITEFKIIQESTSEYTFPVDNVDVSDLKLDSLFAYAPGKTYLVSFVSMYIHFTEAFLFYQNILGVDLSLNLPLKIVTFQKSDSVSYNHEGSRSWILIGGTESGHDSELRPKNREYHEFSHYAMHALYSYLPKSPPGPIEDVNHYGFVNPTTADSYVEGFAHFMSMIIGEYFSNRWETKLERSSPDVCGKLGSVETNYRPWDKDGYLGEELAIAGILWDLYDGEKHDTLRNTINKVLAEKAWQEYLYENDLDQDGKISNYEVIVYMTTGGLKTFVYNEFFFFADWRSKERGFLDKTDIEGYYRRKSDPPINVDQAVEKLFNQGDTDPRDEKLTFKELVEGVRHDLNLGKEKVQELIPDYLTFEKWKKNVGYTVDERDQVSLSLEEIWSILETPKNDFTEVYQALITKFSDQKEAIDEIFKAHGFWMDENPGNGERDPNEPGKGTYYVDYPLGGFTYNEGEKIGTPSNYERDERRSTAYFDGHYVKVNNSVPTYTVTIGIYDSSKLFGVLPVHLYEYTATNNDGLVYLPIPPESYNSTITVEPSGIEAYNPLKFTSEAFYESLETSIEQGFYKEHDYLIPSVDAGEPEPEPEPEPELSPEPEEKPQGIPGFPLETIFLGIILSVLIWIIDRERA